MDYTKIDEKLDELWKEHDGTHFYKDEFKSFLHQIAQESYEEGLHASTPEYIKDMQDAYEKGWKDGIKGLLKKYEEVFNKIFYE